MFAVVCLVGIGNTAPANAETDLERYDAMNITPMPDEFADGLRGEAGEGSAIYNFAMLGACLVFGPKGATVCGAGAIFGEYAFNNRRSIAYVLARQGGKFAKVTTPCMIVNRVRYYCL